MPTAFAHDTQRGSTFQAQWFLETVNKRNAEIIKGEQRKDVAASEVAPVRKSRLTGELPFENQSTDQCGLSGICSGGLSEGQKVDELEDASSLR